MVQTGPTVGRTPVRGLPRGRRRTVASCAGGCSESRGSDDRCAPEPYHSHRSEPSSTGRPVPHLPGAGRARSSRYGCTNLRPARAPDLWRRGQCLVPGVLLPCLPDTAARRFFKWHPSLILLPRGGPAGRTVWRGDVAATMRRLGTVSSEKPLANDPDLYEIAVEHGTGSDDVEVRDRREPTALAPPMVGGAPESAVRRVVPRSTAPQRVCRPPGPRPAPAGIATLLKKSARTEGVSSPGASRGRSLAIRTQSML